jgi:hypothetical protein
MNFYRNILMTSLMLVGTYCLAAPQLNRPIISIYQKIGEIGNPLSDQQALSLAQSSLPHLRNDLRVTLQKHAGYVISISQEAVNSPIQISRINYDANNKATSVVDNYAAVRDPIDYPLQKNTFNTAANEKLLIIAVNGSMHQLEEPGIQKIYNQAISSGYASNTTITILADDATKQSLLKIIPDADIESASLENMEGFLLSPQLKSIFYYGDGFPNAFELGSGDFITAQDFQALIADKTHPFSFMQKTFIANACDAFLNPMGQTIVMQGQADAYVAGLTALSPQGIAVQLFINYVLKDEQPFEQAFADAQNTVGITDFAKNMVGTGIYGMAGTQIRDLFPTVSLSDHSMASIGTLSSDEPFQIHYTFNPTPAILGYTVVSIDLDTSASMQPGEIFTLPLKMPLVQDFSDNFATISPASFTTFIYNYQGQPIYMIGNLTEVFALNRYTGSPASEVIYKDNKNDPTSMPQTITYADPWWNDYYHVS